LFISNPGPEFDQVEFGGKNLKLKFYGYSDSSLRASQMVLKLLSFDNLKRSYDQLNTRLYGLSYAD